MDTHVVFLHGLKKRDLEATWQSGEGSDAEFWPAWLEDDLDNVAVWAVEYPAVRSEWRGDAMSLPDRAGNILPRLIAEPDLTSGTIILVGHSMGGLIIKELLALMQSQGVLDRRVGEFEQRVRKVAFIGTPHAGSNFADIAVFLGRFGYRPSAATRNLTKDAPSLRRLNQWFRNYATENELQVLGLGEHKRTFFGKIVPVGSADLGLPAPQRFHQLDEDHETIVAPANRQADVYVLLKDFVREPVGGQHGRSEILESVAQGRQESAANHNATQAKLDHLLATIDKAALPVSGSNTLVTQELEKRIWFLRRSRFVQGTEAGVQAKRLSLDIQTGELANADKESRRRGLAWCARVLTSTDVAEAERVLTQANLLGAGEENTVAEAFLDKHRDGDRAKALSRLASLHTRLARSASLVIVASEEGPKDCVDWFGQTGWAFDDLDPDGKHILEHKRLEAGLIDDCLADSELLEDADFEAAPVLLMTSAAVNLAVALPKEFRSAVFAHQRFEIDDIILAGDASAMAHRRRAQRYYERAEREVRALGNAQLADIFTDYALWLALLDPASKTEARHLLEASMRDPAHSLRRLPLAIQFHVNIDLQSVERQIESAEAVSGGTSLHSTIARFAIARTKAPDELVSYIQAHRKQLESYYTSEFITSVEIQGLAAAGNVTEGRAKLDQLATSAAVPEEAVRSLGRLLDEAEGQDPVALREAQFRETDTLPDLMSLVQALRQREEWTRLIPFAEALLERAPTIANASLLAEALYRDARFEDTLAAIARFPEFLEDSAMLRGLRAWSTYGLGRLVDAKEYALGMAQSDDRENARQLLTNIAIASGDWSAVNVYVEDEWERRAQLTAEQLLRTAQLAQHVGSSRARELFHEAARVGSGDAGILVACYTAATNAGWEDSAEIHSWLQRAIELSGEDGPVRQYDIKDIFNLQPDWNDREKRTWNGLSDGTVPMFGAGYALNQSLIQLFLGAALSNLDQSDPRHRSIVPAFSGARPQTELTARSLVVDPTALLTLSLLGELETAIEHFDLICIPHSTLGWLLAENQRVAVGQPSEVRSALELKKLVDRGSLQTSKGVEKPNGDLVREVGADLASFLMAADLARSTGRQQVVIRPLPIHRPNSLMQETADLSGYHDLIAGTWEVIHALKSFGQLTSVEEEAAVTYLASHEPRWNSPASLEKGAVLYLDGLTVIYLQHLGLLDRLKPAGFTAIIHESDLDQANALVRYSSYAEGTQGVIETIRSTLSKGILNGKVRLAPLQDDGDDSFVSIRNHPSSGILKAGANAEAMLIDDRFFNRHSWLDMGSGVKKPIATSLDVLGALRRSGKISERVYCDHLGKLRRAGFALIPLSTEELKSLMTDAPVLDGKVSETAELRTIREWSLRVRSTDFVQLPAEHLWFDGMLLTLVNTLRGLWMDGEDLGAAAAKSNWIMQMFDIRGWAHRMSPTDPTERYKAQLLMLMLLPEADERSREAYWSWLEEYVLNDVQEEEPVLFGKIIDAVEEHVSAAVVRTEEGRDGEG